MCLFIETIRIDNGKILNLPRHELRMNNTRTHFWPGSAPLQLAEILNPVQETAVCKARVVYGETGIVEVGYAPYTLRPVHSLALIPSDTIDYTYKSTDREALNSLFAQRGNCDDILIVKQGLLTDTSIANIALGDGSRWYTPKAPLLKGTKRAELLDKGIIQEQVLRREDLSLFSTIRLFNAMIGWGELELPVEDITSPRFNVSGIR